jgi:hypothetical protein
VSKMKFSIEPSKSEKKRREIQARLEALAGKKKQGKLTLEDVDAKLDTIIEMLGEMRK